MVLHSSSPIFVLFWRSYDLDSLAGDEAPSLRTVQRLCKSFKDSRQEIEDLARLGRPIVETIVEYLLNYCWPIVETLPPLIF